MLEYFGIHREVSGPQLDICTGPIGAKMRLKEVKSFTLMLPLDRLSQRFVKRNARHVHVQAHNNPARRLPRS